MIHTRSRSTRARRHRRGQANGAIGKSKKSPANVVNGTMASKKITDYFPVRRSQRRTASKLELEKQDRIRQLIETRYNEDFLRVFECPVKGRGIKAGRPFERDEFVVEYKGDTLTYEEAHRREQAYALDPTIGSYMYFFEHQNRRYCVDATAESPHKGRLVNHSYISPNLKSKVVELPTSLHLCLFAKRNIKIGEELLYDYGDRRSRAVAYNPWLKRT